MFVKVEALQAGARGREKERGGARRGLSRADGAEAGGGKSTIKSNKKKKKRKVEQNLSAGPARVEIAPQFGGGGSPFVRRIAQPRDTRVGPGAVPFSSCFFVTECLEIGRTPWCPANGP